VKLVLTCHYFCGARDGMLKSTHLRIELHHVSPLIEWLQQHSIRLSLKKLITDKS
jgi:hypothetical protein